MKKIIIPLAVILFNIHAQGQQALTNSGSMQIHAGASLSAGGNLTNASTASLVNNGSLYVRGNLVNDQASMSPGSGTLTLNGSSAQTVQGTQSFKTLDLVTSNGSGISLSNNLSVSGTHTFTSGIITTSATPNYMVYEAGSSYTGDNDTRHINGWVKKIGATNFAFPVGNGTVERSVALDNLSASSEFNARYLTPTPYSSQVLSPVVDVNRVEYWSISRVSGGSAAVTLNWDQSKVPFPNWIVSDILVAGYDGSQWISYGGTASGTIAATGTITSNSVSSFNLFTLGSSTYVVPLLLLSFNATRKENYTQIDWTATNESKIDRYVVERSDNGTSFYPVGELRSRNSGLPEQYNTRDYAAITNTAYYRLRCKDVDGRETLSRIVPVTVAAIKQLALLENPVHNRITLMATGTLNGVFNCTLTDMNGLVAQRYKLLMQNSGTYKLDLNANIRPGTYSLEVSNAQESFTFKLIIR